MSKKVLVLAVFAALLVSLVGDTMPAVAAPMGTLTAQCVGNAVYLEWGTHPSATMNILQKGGSYLADLNGAQLSYIDYAITPGQAYTYRVMYRADLPSNEVSIVCGASVYPTYTPTLDISTNPAYSWNSVGATTVSWNSMNASNCSATSYPQTSQWSGAIANSGSTYVSGITANTTFVVDCYSPSHVQRLAYFTMNTPQTPTPTPVPTYAYGAVSMNQSLVNLTSGGQESSSITAVNGDRVQVVIRLTTGNAYASNVYVRDWLPAGMRVVNGTTTIDGASYIDGITTGALRLGNLLPNRTTTIRFQGVVSGAYSGTTLSNSTNVHVDGMFDQTSATTIWIAGTSVVPTPYMISNNNSTLTTTEMALRITGRNVTHGQSGEYTAVSARGNDTLDIVSHIRNRTSLPQYNVQVTDILPAGFSYVSRSTTLNGVVVGDGITSSGINIGTLNAGQEAIVKFSVVISPSVVPVVGRVIVRDTLQVRADGVATLSVQLPVGLSTIWFIAGVQTGPADSIVIAALFGALMTVMYGMYTRTDIFGRRYALASIRQQMQAKSTPNFL